MGTATVMTDTALSESDVLRWSASGRGAMCTPYLIIGGEPEIDVRGLPKPIKWSRQSPWFPRPLCSHHQFSPTSQTSGLVPLLSLTFTMFSKAIFTSIAIGALSVSALVARSPGPEPERELTDRSLPNLITTI